MTLQQQADTAIDTAFRSRVELATVGAAVDIVGEAQGGASDALHDKRHNLGVKVLRADKGIIDVFIKAVSTQVGDVADPSTITDGSIDTQVSAVWNDVAGVKDGE